MGRMFQRLAPEMPLARRILLANLWAFRPVIVRAMLGNDRVAAMLRTTTAATMVSGSPKENVLPIVARGLVNFRILPGDTPEMVLDHVRRVVDDSSVHVEGRGRDASTWPITFSRIQNPGENMALFRVPSQSHF